MNRFDALDEIRRNNYDLLITGIMNADIDGIELLGKVKEINPKMKTLVCSGVDDADVKAAAAKLGVFAYVQKPIVLDQLETAIRGALGT